MKKTRFLVLSAAALLTACSGGTVTGPDEAGPSFEGTPMMGSGGSTMPDAGADGTNATNSGGSSSEPTPSEPEDTQRAGGSLMGSGA